MTLTATPTSAPLPVLRRRWVRVLLWTLGSVAAVVASLVLWLAAMLSGGWDDFLSPGGPTENDREVVAAGNQALEELTQVQLPVGAVAVAEQQECEAGQHNWKVDDAYDLSCVATRTTLGTGQAPAFREQALALHERLAADGWSSDHGDIPSVVREYWDVLASDGIYAPGDLPPGTYVRGSLRLEVRWLSAGGRFPADPSAGEGSFTAPDGSAVDPWAFVTPGRYGVALAVSTESFRA